MVKSLYDFHKNTTIINKDLSMYSDQEGNTFIFNTINGIVRVDYLELTKEEYTVARFQQKIDDLDYSIKETTRPVPKSEITGKDEDKLTITDKKVAVRQVWNATNPYGAYKSFTNKDDAIVFAKQINDEILKYYK